MKRVTIHEIFESTEMTKLLVILAKTGLDITSTTPTTVTALPAITIEAAISPLRMASSRSRRSSAWFDRSASQPVAHAIAKSPWKASIWFLPDR